MWERKEHTGDTHIHTPAWHTHTYYPTKHPGSLSLAKRKLRKAHKTETRVED